MIRSKLSLRRPLAVIGAAVLGLGAATLVVSPASAHHPEISGTFCRIQTSNDYKFSWTVGNSERNYEATIIEVAPGPAGDIKVGGTLPKKGQGVLSGTETRTAAAQRDLNKNLMVKAQWVKPDRTVTESRTVSAQGTGKCKDVPPPTTPPATPTPTPEATPTPTATPEPQPTTPAPTTPVPTPSATLPPVEPVLTVEETCDELIFTFENPQGGEAFEVTLTPNKGEAQTITVESGETETVKFPAEEGLSVVLSDDEEESDPITWTKPEECDSDGGGGGLPVTGAAAGGIAAGALLLLGAGAALFIVARRRRVTFTA